MTKTSKTFNLPKQWCEAREVYPPLDDLSALAENIERTITEGVLVTVLEYAINPALMRQTNERLKADLDAQLANETIKIEMSLEDGLVTFLETYGNKYQMSHDYVVMLFYQRSIALFPRYRLTSHLDDLIHAYDSNYDDEGANAVKENMIKIFDGFGIYFDQKIFTLILKTPH